MITRRKFIINSSLSALALGLGVYFKAGASIPFDDELRKKAAGIHDRILTIDSHCDTPLAIRYQNLDLGVRNNPYKTGSKVDLIRMKEGGLDASFFAVFLGQGKRDTDANDKAYKKALDIFEAIHTNVKKYPELAELAFDSKDAERLHKTGKRAIFMGIENGYAIGTDIKYLKEFYDLGARYMTLCHSSNNDICDSSTDKKGAEHDGLSKFGGKVVKEMNRLGIMVDVSHVADKSFYDVIKKSKVPVIASHSSARAICDHPRNMTDDMLRTLAEYGGVIQLCILSAYIKTPKPNLQRDSARSALYTKYNNFVDLTEEQNKSANTDWKQMNLDFPTELATVKDAVDHIDHIVKVAGIDHIGIGTDFDGGGDLSDCFDASELGNITYELVKRDYSEADIAKIWGGNFMRVFQEVEQFAKK